MRGKKNSQSEQKCELRKICDKESKAKSGRSRPNKKLIDEEPIIQWGICLVWQETLSMFHCQCPLDMYCYRGDAFSNIHTISIRKWTDGSYRWLQANVRCVTSLTVRRVQWIKNY